MAVSNHGGNAGTRSRLTRYMNRLTLRHFLILACLVGCLCRSLMDSRAAWAAEPGPSRSAASEALAPQVSVYLVLEGEPVALAVAASTGVAAGNITGGGAGAGRVPGKNPYKRGDGWNLTEQMRLEKTDPGMAARLQAAACWNRRRTPSHRSA